jgi:type VI secretion system secreted protein Hcp
MAATIIYMSVEGAKQGKFKGDVPGKSKPNVIRCYYYGYAVNTTRDASSGMASGKRQHGPIVIHKVINNSSPQFMQALISNEVLKTVIIELRTATKPYYTITLQNASISSIQHSVPEIDQTPDALEEIELVFQKITFKSADGSTVNDDWTAHA